MGNPDYRWMTKVAIHLMDNVEDFITTYQIPKEDIDTVKALWENAKTDWDNFKSYASDNQRKTKVVKTSIKTSESIEQEQICPTNIMETNHYQKASPRKLQSCKLVSMKQEEKKYNIRCRNARIMNRIHQYNFLEEEEEDLINKYIDELNYQKAKKLSDLISFYEEDGMGITPSLGIA